MSSRTAVPLCALLLCSAAAAADFSHYRGFELGSKMANAGLQQGVNISSARLVQQRPAVIEEVDWRPVFHYDKVPSDADPVREVLLRFFNQKLFQIVVTYDRQRIQGMTEADLIQAISSTYGPASPSGSQIVFHSSYAERATVLAQWGNDEYVYSLVRTGDQSSFALIATLARMDTMAQESMIEAHRLDVLEAPQKAIDLKAKEASAQQTQMERARLANIPNFRP